MNVSVIIPTYNGAHKIMGILKSLEQQTSKPDEVIIVVDGSTDDTVQILQQERFSFTAFRIVEQENGGRSKVRNRGAKNATGDLLIFFDDDMVPEFSCIAQHLLHHKKHQGSIVTGAQIDSTGTTDIQQYKAKLSRQWALPLQKLNNQPLGKTNLFLTAANFSIAKALFFQLEGFDERLTDVEDFDLAVRAFQQDIPLFYNHAAFAFHNDPINGKRYIHRLREYRKAHEKLRFLKPELYKDFKFHQPVYPTGIKRSIFLFFTKQGWINWLDKNGWIKKILPRSFRYKLYDLITTANGVYFPEKVKLF